MKTFRKIIRLTTRVLLGTGAFIALYLVIMFTLSRIPINNKNNNDNNVIPVYIKSNGVHTDIVFPLKNQWNDWTKVFDPTQTRSADSTFQYAAIGWGDRDFYLNMPEWKDLKARTAFNAAFYLGSGAMHVSFYHRLTESENCIKILVSPDDYRKMCDFALSSFSKRNGQTLRIPDASYGDHDLFFEAIEKYNLFYTCNSWANNCLKAGNQKAALWSLTDTGILCHYRD